MARRRMPPSQGWKTFLRNHADGIASMDLFLVSTIFKISRTSIVRLRPPGLAGGTIGSTTAHSAPVSHIGRSPANQAPIQNHNRFIGLNNFLDRLLYQSAEWLTL